MLDTNFYKTILTNRQRLDKTGHFLVVSFNYTGDKKIKALVNIPSIFNQKFPRKMVWVNYMDIKVIHAEIRKLTHILE